MTITDANKLLALAKANYSYAFKSMSQQEKVMLVQSWAFALQDVPADIVMLAFMELLSTSKWLPTVADIREQVKRLYYEALYPAAPGRITTTKSEAARAYIIAQTQTLRGDFSPQLSLDAILAGTYGLEIGSGRMEFTALEQAERLPGAEDEKELTPHE